MDKSLGLEKFMSCERERRSDASNGTKRIGTRTKMRNATQIFQTELFNAMRLCTMVPVSFLLKRIVCAACAK